MTIVIFGFGVLVFFLTVYGTVVAGGVQLTKQQLEVSPDLAPDLAATADERDSDEVLLTSDVLRADF
jgi:hypothetical protein